MTFIEIGHPKVTVYQRNDGTYDVDYEDDDFPVTIMESASPEEYHLFAAELHSGDADEVITEYIAERTAAEAQKHFYLKKAIEFGYLESEVVK